MFSDICLFYATTCVLVPICAHFRSFNHACDVFMKLEHAALWSTDLEASCRFYAHYFGGFPGARYENPATGFRSYFLRFEGGSRLELMQMPGIVPRAAAPGAQSIGLVHLAFEASNTTEVDHLTATLQRDGHPIVGAPRHTGDGYYESTVLDPDGNRIEIVTTPRVGTT